MNFKIMILTVAVALLQIPVLANVTTGTWIMDQSNTFADGVNYGSVTISANDSTGVVSFTVDASTAPYSSISNNFGIQTFGFNDNVSDPVSSWSFSLPSGWSHGSGNEDGFGSFMVTTSGTGNSRQDPLIFSITLPTAGDAVANNFAVLSSGGGQGSVFFAAHVAGFTVNGSDFTSNFIGGGATPTVPAPGAMLLGGIGVSIVGWLRRRRQL